jgi:hypothetical protein
MDLDGRIKQRIMTYAVGTAHSAVALAADEALLVAHLRLRVGGTWHPRGTCRMGRCPRPDGEGLSP